jgi:hypothetical protein
MTYELAVQTLAKSKPNGTQDLILYTRVAILASEMSYYMANPVDWPDALFRLKKKLNAVGAPRETRASLQLSLSRLLRQAERIDEEADALAACVPTRAQRFDYEFRLISLALYRKDTHLAPPSMPIDVAVEGLSEKMDLLNIAADRARFRVLTQEPERAYRDLADIFMSARKLFFRRSMYATGLALAQLAHSLCEPEWAMKWLVLAAQFTDCGRGIPLSVEALRADIIAAAPEMQTFQTIRHPDDLRTLARRFGE